MIGLHTWLAREGRRQAARANLWSALWLGRGVAYAQRRLAPVWLGLGLRSALHAAELYLLSLALPYEYLAPLFAFRTWLALASTAYWGALEPLRREVRELAAARQLTAASERVSRGLSGAVWSFGVPLALCSAQLARELWQGRGLELVGAYAWACALRLLLDSHARAYHAGAYACRRVYRPWWSFVSGDALSLGLIALGFPRLGVFCVPLAIVLSAALEALLARRFASRTYRLLRVPLPRLRWRAPRLAGLGAALLPALANLSMQLDALLLLVLLESDPPRAEGLSLTALYYVLRPLLGIGAQWARVFYFDLSRLEAGSLRALRVHLRRYLRSVGAWCALLVVLSSCLAVELFERSARWQDLAILSALTLARGWLAPAQLEAFVQRRYGLLCALALGFLGSLALAAPWLDAEQLVGLAALLCTLAALRLPAPLASPVASTGVCGLPEWLARVEREPSGQLAVLHVAKGALPASRVAQALAHADSAWSVAQLGQACLLLASAKAPALELPALVAAAAGSLERAAIGPRGSGPASLLGARLSALLPAELARALESEAPPPEQLLHVFAERFPGGRVLDMLRGVGDLRGLGLSASQLAEVHAQLISASVQRAPLRPGRSPVRLSVFAPRGAARWVFVVPRGSAGFAAFSAEVRAATWRASLYGAPAPRRAPAPSREARSLQRPLGTHDV